MLLWPSFYCSRFSCSSKIISAFKAIMKLSLWNYWFYRRFSHCDYCTEHIIIYKSIMLYPFVTGEPYFRNWKHPAAFKFRWRQLQELLNWDYISKRRILWPIQTCRIRATISTCVTWIICDFRTVIRTILKNSLRRLNISAKIAAGRRPVPIISASLWNYK